METETATNPEPEVIRPQVVYDDQPEFCDWTMHAWQARAFMATERFLVWPAGRRCGKSEFAVMWTIHQYREARARGLRGVIWIVYPTYGIARTAWRKFKRLMPAAWVSKYIGTEQQPQAILLRGGITIEFKSGANPGALVGEGLLAAWLDECGEIKERVWSESLRPTLADHIAPALLTGTPKGHNWYWKEFQKGWDPEFEDIASIGISQAQGIPSHENPYLELSEIEDMGREMSKRLFEQEILARFLSDEGAVLQLERVRAKGLAFSKNPTVALGIDLARRADFTVLIGMDRDYAVTHFERFNNIDWPLQKKRVEKTWLALDKPAIVIDATGVGDPMVQELQYGGVYIAEPFMFNAVSKRQLVESLAIACDEALLTLPDEPVLLNEMEAFEMTQLPSGNVRYAAPEDQHDDCVMALGLALRGAQRYGDLGISIGRIR
jgi:hypothetical protein